MPTFCNDLQNCDGVTAAAERDNVRPARP